MRKILALILVCATLLSMCMLPISAADVTPSSTGQVATSVVGKPMVIDGEMGADEGWGEAVAILNKYRDTADKSVFSRGNVYLTYDIDYLYFFVEIDSEYVGEVSSNSLWQSVIKADFGEYIGVEERHTWGVITGSKLEKFSTTYMDWTTNAEESKADVCANNNNSDGTYTVELKLPIPFAAQKAIREGDFEVKISVYQGIGTGGVFLSDVTEEHTGNMNAGVRNEYVTVTLPALDGPQAVEFPMVHNVKNITIDGQDTEGWALLDYSLLKYGIAESTTLVSSENQSKVWFGTDGQYIYVYFETLRDNHGDGTTKNNSPLFYWNMNFPSINKNQRLVLYLGGTYGGGTAMADSWSNAENFKVVKGTDKTVVEACIAIPETEKEALKTGSVTVQMNVIEKYKLNVHDQAMVPHEDIVNEALDYTVKVNVELPQNPIADNESRVVGVQWRENPDDDGATRDVRFLAAIGDYKAYEEIGFDFTMDGTPGSVNSFTVYNSIVADGKTLYAETYGGKYFFAYTLSGLEKGKTYEFTAKSYTKAEGQDKTNSAEFTVTVTIDADGEVTFS